MNYMDIMDTRSCINMCPMMQGEYNNMNPMMSMCPMIMNMQGHNMFQPKIKLVKLEEIKD